MIRFKLRTLLIATALICVFLGLQVYVHNRAKRFAEEMTNGSEAMIGRLLHDTGGGAVGDVVWHAQTEVHENALTFTDVLLIRRRVEVSFVSVHSLERSKNHVHHYEIHSFGATCAVRTK